MNNMKMINGTYNVTDCEHNGDMRNAINEISNIKGCKVTNSYWDGRDCGEAYVEFTFSSDIFLKVYNELLGSSVYYDDDINNYISSSNVKGVLLNAFKATSNEFSKMYNETEQDITMLLNGKVCINLLFEDSEYETEVVDYAFNQLGKDATSIKCYKSSIIDGCRMYHVLFLTDINKVDSESLFEIEEWLKAHHVYGKVQLHTILWGCISGDKCSELRGMVDLIRNKQKLFFMGYWNGKIGVSYDEYFVGNEFKVSLQKNNDTYYISRYEFQV